MRIFRILSLTYTYIVLEITRHDSTGLESLESEAGGLREPIKYFDIYRERPVRLTVRALVPTKEHPKVESELSELLM